MKSSQLSEGLTKIAKKHYSEAESIFERLLASEAESNPHLYYYYAVANLGRFLSHKTKKQNIQLRHTNFYPLFLDEEKVFSPQRVDILKTVDELYAILTQFELAREKSPTIVVGIEVAINHFLKDLFFINQYDSKQRTKGFAKELKKFQLHYSTKLCLSQIVMEVKEEYLVPYFIPDKIKKIHKILMINMSDSLFLSSDQLQALIQLYRFNKKNDDLFERIAEYLFLEKMTDYKEYYAFWKKFRSPTTIEKVLLIHEIYTDIELKKLCFILNELNNQQLIDDKILTLMANLLLPTKTFCVQLKQFTYFVISKQLNNEKELLLNLFAFVLDDLLVNRFKTLPVKNYLEYIKHNCIYVNEKINLKKIFSYLDLLYVFINDNEENILFEQVTGLMKAAELAIGSESFISVSEKVLNYHMSSINIIVIMNLTVHLNNESAQTLLQIIDTHHNDLHTIKLIMNDLIRKEHAKKYPERCLEEVLNDFKTISCDVAYPLETPELKQLEIRFLQIQAIGNELLIADKNTIVTELKKSQIYFNRDPTNELAQCTLLAIIRLKIKETLGINPYNMQMLNVLALINQPKRIAQVKTGEGKSTLIAMLAAYYGLSKQKVDVITTSHDLAIRDIKKFKEFYLSIGLHASHNGNSSHYLRTIYERNDIIYGTIADFEFAYLRGETEEESNGRGIRPYDVVIVDEVDSMFIDMQRHQAILSHPSEETFTPDVYKYIWIWINHTEVKKQTKQNLQAMLKSKGIKVDMDLAATWLKSAHTAQRLVEDKEYIITYPEDTPWEEKNNNGVIRIVNKTHTGEVQDETTRWQGGLHELLEAKHNLKICIESLTIGMISHIDYFNKYKILMGLTGTLGLKACRDQLFRLYKVTTYDSPAYRPSAKQELPHRIVLDEKAQLQAIFEEAQTEINCGRAVLILCESIKVSRDIFAYLSHKINSIQIYNGMQKDTPEFLLDLAGHSGVVTIATNLAGRGTDIITTPETEAHGGLHIIMTFPAINLRVEQQAFGRTGRQGKKGTYHYILHDNQLSSSENQGKNTEEKILLMRANREANENNISICNIVNYNIIHKIFIIQSIFFALPKPIKFQHMVAWCKFNTDISKYVMRYLRNELEKLDQDAVIDAVMKKFFHFWKVFIAKKSLDFKTPYDFVISKLKQFIVDKNFKKTLIEGIILLENPKIYFSDELIDIIIELKSSELEEKFLPKQDSMPFHLISNVNSLPVKSLSKSIENFAKKLF